MHLPSLAFHVVFGKTAGKETKILEALRLCVATKREQNAILFEIDDCIVGTKIK